MKKLLFSLVPAILLSLLTGCTSNNYKLVKEEGNCYVIMNMDIADSEHSMEPLPAIYYASLEEMIDDLQNGNFTEEELYRLSKHPRIEDGKIKIPNLDALAEPVVPDSLGEYRISHYGDAYNFNYYDEEGEIDFIFAISQKEYYDEYIKRFVNYEAELADRDQLVITQDPERNATVYTWTAFGNDCKQILYSISANETVYYVEESYDVEDSGKISQIYIWFEYHGQYVFVSKSVPDGRPSVEWITSFSVKPHKTE